MPRIIVERAVARVTIENEYCTVLRSRRGEKPDRLDDTDLSYFSRIHSSLKEMLDGEIILYKLREYFGEPMKIPLIDDVVHALKGTRPRYEVIEEVFGIPAASTKNLARMLISDASGGTPAFQFADHSLLVPQRYSAAEQQRSEAATLRIGRERLELHLGIAADRIRDLGAALNKAKAEDVASQAQDSNVSGLKRPSATV